MNVRRGDIYYADLSPVVGSEQGGLRPVLIVQNDVGNRHSPTVIAAAITSRMSKTRLPTHIDVYANKVGLAKDSVILLEQIRTIDKKRLKEKMGHLDDSLMYEVDTAISISFGLNTADAVNPMPAAFYSVSAEDFINKGAVFIRFGRRRHPLLHIQIFLVNAMRLRFRSTSFTATVTTSPTDTTSDGCLMNLLLISEMWTSPS